MPQYSPVTLWLLAAATICIDAIVFTSAGAFRGDFSTLLFFGLAFGQISVATIWAAYSKSPLPVRCLLICAATAIAAWFTSRVEPLRLLESLALYATDMVVLMVTLLVLRAISHRYGKERKHFSILQLFGAITIVAIVMSLLRHATTLQEEWAFTAGFILINTVIAVGCLFFSNLNRHWILRLAGAVGIGLFAGWSLTSVRPSLSGDLEAMAIVQAFIVFVWLDATQITKDAPRLTATAYGSN
jgi:hypothetical protein